MEGHEAGNVMDGREVVPRTVTYPEGYGRPLVVPEEAWRRTLRRFRIITTLSVVFYVFGVGYFIFASILLEDPFWLVLGALFSVNLVIMVQLARAWSRYDGPSPAVFSRGVLCVNVNRMDSALDGTFVPFESITSTSYLLGNLRLRTGLDKRPRVMMAKVFDRETMEMVRKMAGRRVVESEVPRLFVYPGSGPARDDWERHETMDWGGKVGRM